MKRAIPESVWRRLPCFIVHPGPVGDRGPSALDWAILKDFPRWGVTVLQAVAGMDSGQVWASAEFLMRDAAKSSLYRNEVTHAAVKALLAAIDRFSNGRFEPALPALTYRQPAVTQKDRAIDWSSAGHLTHFYMFFMPDFVAPVYAKEAWFGKAQRFRAAGGDAQREFLPCRAEFMHIMGLIAGRWPHRLGLQPGVLACAIGPAEQARLASYVLGFRRHLEAKVFGEGLERVASLGSAAELYARAASGPAASSDFGQFLAFAAALNLDTLGQGPGLYLSYGAYSLNFVPAFTAGVFENGAVRPFIAEDIREDHASAWLVRGEGPCYPASGLTLPDIEAKDAYSWCKAPRLGGRVAETGACGRAGARRRGNAGLGATHRAILRSLHGLHGALY